MTIMSNLFYEQLQNQSDEIDKKEIYNQAVEDCCKILSNAVDENYIDGFAYSVILLNFNQLKR